MPKPIAKNHEVNAKTLRDAFISNRVTLQACVDRATGKSVVLLCAVNTSTKNGKEMKELVPMALLLEGEPRDLYIPPDEEKEWGAIKEKNWNVWVTTAPNGLLYAEVQANNRRIIEIMKTRPDQTAELPEEVNQLTTKNEGLMMVLHERERD